MKCKGSDIQYYISCYIAENQLPLGQFTTDSYWSSMLISKNNTDMDLYRPSKISKLQFFYIQEPQLNCLSKQKLKL